MKTTSLDRYITTSTAVPGDKPHIAGRRISVADIAVWHEQMGKSVAEIAGEYQLTPVEIHAALAYYFEHKAEIDARLANDEEFVRELAARTPSLLKARLSDRQSG